jgi:hypothetical protein
MQPSRSTYIKWGSAAISLIWLAVYVWFYRANPFGGPAYDYADNWGIDLLTFVPALAAAGMATLVALQYQPGEIPRRIWLTFAIGWWCWVGGEIAGMVYDYFYWDTAYPELTLIDLCWSAGYILFGLALFYQFRAIYAEEEKNSTYLYLTLCAAALILTLGLTYLARRSGLGEDVSAFALYLAILYPVFDLVEGGAALWLFLLFRRGKWGRPWWGLIAFAIADSISIYFWIGGDEALSQKTVDILYLFSDTTYVGAYLIVALAFLSHYYMLQWPPASPKPNRP